MYSFIESLISEGEGNNLSGYDLHTQYAKLEAAYKLVFQRLINLYFNSRRYIQA